MLKKTALCLFSFALLLGSGNALFAQEAPELTLAPKALQAVQFPEGTKLTPEELRVALEKSSCSTAPGQKSANLCAACTETNCAGTCYIIPCGTPINADQFSVAGFWSFVTGCTITYVSTCNDVPSAPAGCRLYSYLSTVYGNKTCINSRVLLQSVGCY
jgi:hypothetical protein